MNVEDPWAWWSGKLAGDTSLQMNPDNPHAGFYRWVRREGYGGKRYAAPVAYWPEDGELKCRINHENVTAQRGQAIWQSVGNHPVPEDWYRSVAEEDKPEWPDGLGITPPVGSNLPPDADPFEELGPKIAELADKATVRLKGPAIADQVEADKLANELIDPLAELWKLAEEARKEERKPHDDALRAIQQKWFPLLTAAEVYKSLKYKLTTPWLVKVKAQQKQEAEAAAAAGEPITDTRRPRAGTRGRAISLKTSKRAEIIDYPECLKFFAENPEVRQTVQDLANRMVRSGLTVPGTTVITEEQAV